VADLSDTQLRRKLDQLPERADEQGGVPSRGATPNADDHSYGQREAGSGKRSRARRRASLVLSVHPPAPCPDRPWQICGGRMTGGGYVQFCGFLPAAHPQQGRATGLARASRPSLSVVHDASRYPYVVLMEAGDLFVAPWGPLRGSLPL